MKKKLSKILKINFLLIVIICAVVACVNQSCSSAKYGEKEIQMEKIKHSPQLRDGKFRNNSEWVQPSLIGNIGIMWKFFTGGKDRTPKFQLPHEKTDLTYFNSKSHENLSSSWLGHSTLLINIDGYRIITDPVFEKSASFFGPTRFKRRYPCRY